MYLKNKKKTFYHVSRISILKQKQHANIKINIINKLSLFSTEITFFKFGNENHLCVKKIMNIFKFLV